MTIALFPGQGVQKAGMAGDLAGLAPAVFDQASQALGIDMVALCEGTSDDASLDVTLWAQPAVLTCGVAAFTAFGADVTAAAGHSVGEYAALVAAGALDLDAALELVRARATAMDDASTATPSGMAAVGKTDLDTVTAICQDTGVALAADNAPGQLVISGPDAAVEEAMAAIKEAGGIAKRLDVAGAFHSPVMEPAIEPLRSALDAAAFAEPAIEIWSSTTARPVSSPSEIVEALLSQLTAPVRWRQTIEGLAGAHSGTFVDMGPGKVVAGLARKSAPDAEVRTLRDLQEVTA